MRWRLIPYAVSDGQWNMAVDEAILQSLIDGSAPPTIRFYGWPGQWVTIGRLQPASSVPEGWGSRVVRRPTGGRAVLHGRDLTFSLAVPASVLGSPVAESYKRTAEAIACGLKTIGIDAELCRQTTPPGSIRKTNNCFDLTLAYELAVDGRKVLGSAQVRRAGVVLQQNSLALPRSLPVGDLEGVVEAISASIASEFGVQLEKGRISPQELQNARLLADNKYVIVSAEQVAP